MTKIYPRLRVRPIVRAASLLLFCSFLFCAASAQTRFAVASGSWTSAIWASSVNGAAGSAAVPVATDAVTIKNGVTVTLPASYSATVASLRLNEGSNGTAKLSFSLNSQLDVSGALTWGGGGPNNMRVGQLDMQNGGTITCTSLVNNNGASLTPGAGTIVINGAATLPGSVLNYNNLTLNGNVSLGATTASTYTVTGLLTLQSGTLSFGINSLSLSGGISRTSGLLQTGSGNLSISAATPMTLSPDIFAAAPTSLTLSGSVTLLNSLQVAGNVTVNSGALDVGSGYLSRSGSSGALTVANGATLRIGGTGTGLPSGFTYSFGNTSTVEYNGDVQTITAGSYGHLLLSGGAKTLAGTTTVNGNLTTSADLNGNGQNLVLGGSWTNTGVADLSTSGVQFAGTSQQTIPSIAYGHITVSNTAGAKAAGALSIATSVTVAAGATLDMDIYDLAMASVSNSGTIRTSSTSASALPAGFTWGGTVSYAASAAQNIVTGQYANLNLSGGNRVFASGGQYTITGTLTPGSGSITLAGSSLIFSGTGAQTLPAWSYHNLQLSGSRGNNNISFSSGTTGIAGNFVVDATFTNGTFSVPVNSTIALQGTAQQRVPFHSKLAYQNLSVLNTGGTVLADGAFTVSGKLLVETGATLDMGSFTLNGTLSDNTVRGTLRTAAATPFSSGRSFAGTGTLEFYGSGTQSIPTGTYYHLIISGDRVNNKVNFPSSGTISVAGDLTISANVSGVNGGYSTNGNTIALNGTNQNLSVTGVNQATGASFEFNNLNISGGGVKTLQTPVSIGNSLGLGNGVLLTTSTNILTLNLSAATSGANNTSYVDGPLRKLGNSAFVFPLGKAGVYAPIGLTAMSSSSGVFEAEYFRSGARAISTSVQAPLTLISNCEYWALARTSGTAQPRVNLYWSASSPCNTNVYITDPSKVRIARFDTNQSSWVDGGVTSFSGTGTTGSIQSGAMAEYGFFTLSSNSALNPLPVRFVWARAAHTASGVEVSWETATEVNVDRYEVEYSADGRSFASVLRQPVRQNNGGGSTYRATDPGNASGKGFYRVKAVDIDGKLTYSSVLRLAGDRGAGTLSIYPNPATGRQLTLQAASVPAGMYTVRVFDATGREAFRRQVQHPGGTAAIGLQLPEGLSAGTYFLRLTGADAEQTTSFLLR